MSSRSRSQLSQPTKNRGKPRAAARSAAPKRVASREVKRAAAGPRRVLRGSATAVAAAPPGSGDVAVSAPVAVNERLNQTFSMSGDMFGGIRVHCRIPLCVLNTSTVVSGYTPGAMTFAQASYTGSSIAPQASVCTALLNPWRMGIVSTTNPSTVTYASGVAYPNCQFLTQISACFGRYRLPTGRFKLTYEPQYTTADSTRYSLAYANDPYHPQIGMRAYTAAQWPSTAILDDTPNVMVFSPWVGWTMEFPTDPSYLYYTYSTPVYTTTGAVYYPEQMRQSFFGALTCLSTNSTAINNTGRLFIDATFEFRDPYPINILTFQTSYARSMLRVCGPGGATDRSGPDEYPDDDEKEAPVVVETDRRAVAAAPLAHGARSPSVALAGAAVRVSSLK